MLQLIWPIALPVTISSGLRDVRDIPGARIHEGVDLAVPIGSKVVAPCDARVVSARFNPSYGNRVRLAVDTAEGTWYIWLAHLHSMVVTEGEQVKQGQLIGLSGNTGNSTGPHLHFGVQSPLCDELIEGMPEILRGSVDPLQFLPKAG